MSQLPGSYLLLAETSTNKEKDIGFGRNTTENLPKKELTC